MQKRKRSQQDREDKTAKRLAKLKTKRGKKMLQQQQEAEQDAPAAHPVADADGEPDEDQKYEAPPVQVPDEWSCKLADASKGKFVVLEVVFNSKKKGIAVAQVYY